MVNAIKQITARTWLPFTCGLLGVLVGAAIARAPGNQAHAAGDETIDAHTIRAEVVYAKRVFVSKGDTFPNVTIEPRSIALQGSDELGEALLTQESLQLQNVKAKQTLRIDADLKGGSITRRNKAGEADAVFEAKR